MNGAAHFFTALTRRVVTNNNNSITTLSAIARNSTRSTSSLSYSIPGKDSSCSMVGTSAARSILGGSGSSSSTMATASFFHLHRHPTGTVITNATNNDEQRRYGSNRARRGLYDGKDVRSGNNLSFSMKHTKRTFKPNVFVKRVYSEILDEMVKFHLTTSTLRSIDKCGGLDNYLLTSKHIRSGEGLRTKKKIVQALKYRERKARRDTTVDGTTTTTDQM